MSPKASCGKRGVVGVDEESAQVHSPGMIELLIATSVAAASPLTEPMEAYVTCWKAEAIALSRSDEPAEVVVTAASAGCIKERMAYRSAALDGLHSMPEIHASQVRVLGKLEEQWRSEMLRLVIQTRMRK